MVPHLRLRDVQRLVGGAFPFCRPKENMLRHEANVSQARCEGFFKLASVRLSA